MEKTKKMTKRDYFNEIIALATENGRDDLVAFAQKEKDLLAKKSESKTNSPRQKANEQLLLDLRDVMTDEPKRIKEIVELLPKTDVNGDEITNGRVSSLLTKYVDEEFERVVIKKDVYFKIKA